MPVAAPFPSRSAGEKRTFSLDLTSDLAAGDHIASVVTSLVSIPPTQDGNAPGLLASGAQILNNGSSVPAVVAQLIGTNTSNTVGFISGVTYMWTIKATTANGEILVWTANIPIL